MGLYDEDERVEDASELAREIDIRLDKAYHHMNYIDRALDMAQDYARGLRGQMVSADLIREASTYLASYDKLEYSFDYANEAALELRRAGDIALNDRYA